MPTGVSSEDFYTEAEFAGLGTIPMTFIRAPYIASVQKNVKVLATVDEKIVCSQTGKPVCDGISSGIE